MLLQFLIMVITVLLSYHQGWCQSCNSVDENEFRDSRFIFYHGITDSVYRTFDNVRSHCETLGGHMAIITSAEQNEFLAERLSRDNLLARYWIGLEDVDNDNTFTWIDGTTPKYKNWALTISNAPENRCVHMITSTDDSIHGQWDRDDCNIPRRHICQIPIVPPALTEKPEAYKIGMSNTIIRWASWNMSKDIGEGPVLAYKVYITAKNETTERTETFLPSQVLSETLDYNITGLESGKLYVIQVAVIRNGFELSEGEKGPELVVKTHEPGIVPFKTTEFHPVSVTMCPVTAASISTSRITAGNIVSGNQPFRLWFILFVISMTGVVVLGILVVFLCIRLRRKLPNASPRSDLKSIDPTPRYENQAFDSTSIRAYEEITAPSKQNEGEYEELKLP